MPTRYSLILHAVLLPPLHENTRRLVRQAPSWEELLSGLRGIYETFNIMVLVDPGDYFL